MHSPVEAFLVMPGGHMHASACVEPGADFCPTAHGVQLPMATPLALYVSAGHCWQGCPKTAVYWPGLHKRHLMFG